MSFGTPFADFTPVESEPFGPLAEETTPLNEQAHLIGEAAISWESIFGEPLQPVAPPISTSAIGTMREQELNGEQSSVASNRYIRKARQKCRDRRKMFKSNTHIPERNTNSQDLRTLLNPYGSISSNEITRFWSLLHIDRFGYTLTVDLNRAIRCNESVLLPFVEQNLIPPSILDSCAPLGCKWMPEEVNLGPIGNTTTFQEVTYNVKIGDIERVLPFRTSKAVQTLVLGNTAQIIFGLYHSETYRTIINCVGQHLDSVKVPLNGFP